MKNYQDKCDVIKGSTAGTPQNNLPNQGNGSASNTGSSTSADAVKMVQGKDGIGGSTSGLGK